MTSELAPGSVVHYQPKRVIFAQSSGSFTGNPAIKRRPCVVVQTSEDSITIAPFCGARQKSRTEWVRRRGMVADWWHPAQFTNSDAPVPPDDIAITRKPLIITHDPSLPKPEFYGGLKPTYIWVGDIGESIPADQVLTLDRIDPYISMSTEEIDKIRQQRLYWDRNHRVTSTD